MIWFQALVLGLVQGLTEFFPVSSSGHLILTPVFFGWSDQGSAFDTILHLGTLTALLIYFRVPLWSLCLRVLGRSEIFFRSELPEIRSFSCTRARLFVCKVIVATLPTLILAAFFDQAIESVARNARLVGFDLAFWGMILFIVDHFWPRPFQRTEDEWSVLEELTWKQIAIVGLAQPLSLLPGTSRSGITITAGLLAGLSRATAARFSFFLSIPVTAAAGLFGVYKFFIHGIGEISILSLFLGFAVSCLVGAWAIRFLVSYVSQKRFDLFVVYRLLLALVVLWFIH